MVDSIDVHLTSCSYSIKIGSNILDDATLLHHLPYSNVLIVTNTKVAPLYLQKLLDTLSGADKLESLILPDGEPFKTWASVEAVIDKLLMHQMGRDTTLIALGGGVIGDLVGFTASCYQRGIPCIQVPTTLLAQVDSSVGGKTAINHVSGKNMIGAFHQPHAVWIDLETLKTLPEREYLAGLAEVVKYGALSDLAFFEWLELNAAAVCARDSDILNTLIRHCCLIKADIVSQDEREQGIRALLNLGHTFGHALESDSHYETYLHGEAVAIGLVMAAQLSEQLGDLKGADVMRLKRLLQHLKIPVTLKKAVDFESIFTLMQRDKKNRSGQIHLVLLESLGQAKIIKRVPKNLIQQIIEDYA